MYQKTGRTVARAGDNRGLYYIRIGALITKNEAVGKTVMKFCAWCLLDFRYTDEKTASLTPSGHVAEVKAETIMMAPAAGFYATPGSGVNQVRLAYVLCKEPSENVSESIVACRVFGGAH